MNTPVLKKKRPDSTNDGFELRIFIDEYILLAA